VQLARRGWGRALFDSLLQGGPDRDDYQDLVNRYDQGPPYAGISDDEAIGRYQQVAPELSPEVYQQSPRTPSAAWPPRSGPWSASSLAAVPVGCWAVAGWRSGERGRQSAGQGRPGRIAAMAAKRMLYWPGLPSACPVGLRPCGTRSPAAHRPVADQPERHRAQQPGPIRLLGHGPQRGVEAARLVGSKVTAAAMTNTPTRTSTSARAQLPTAPSTVAVHHTAGRIRSRLSRS
jgi:hypothetical protein